MSIRAVTFQSIARTSSPDWYSRSVGEVEPVAVEQAPVVALEQAVQAADDLPVEALEDALRRRRGRHVLLERDDGDGDPAEDRGSRSVGGDVVGERLEGQDEPVAHDVVGHVEDVLRQDVVAAADEGERPGGEDQVDRGARAGPVGDVALELRQPVRAAGVARRGREPDGVLDQGRVDVDRVDGLLELDQVVGREDPLDRLERGRSSARRSRTPRSGSGSRRGP